MQVQEHEGEFRENWPAVVAAFLGIALGSPVIPMFGFGLFIAHVARDFAWSTASVAGGLAVFTVVMALSSPFAGRLIDKAGPLRILWISLPVTSIGLALLTVVNGNSTLYYALWVIIGLSAGGNNPIVWMKLLVSRFNKNRGLAIGLASSGTAFYMLVITATVRAVIDGWGWQTGLLFMAALPVVILPPVILFLLRPTRNNALPGEEAATAVAEASGPTFGEVVREWRFWVMIFAAICMAVAPGMATHLETVLQSKELPVSTIIAVTSTLGIMMLIGRVFAGFLADRVWSPGLLAFALVMMAGAGYGMVIDGPIWILFASVICLGLATGAEFDLSAFITARYFGLRSYGLVFGLIYGLSIGLGGIWSMIIGRMVDMTGSYASAFHVVGIVTVVGAAAVCGLSRAPVRAPVAPAA